MQPLGCLPCKRETTSKTGSTGACEEEITTLAKLHNKAFSEVLEKLERQLNGFKYSITNWYTAFSERINNPSKYGMPCPFFVVPNKFNYNWCFIF
jgi:thiamine pyrophosphokinase